MCRRTCPHLTVKKIIPFLLCLTVIAYILPIHFNYCSLSIYSLRSSNSSQTLNQWQLLLPDCQIWRNDRTLHSSVAVNETEVTSLLTRGSICRLTKREDIIASCPECFKQRVDQLSHLIRDLSNSDTVPGPESNDYFKIKPTIVESVVYNYLIAPSFNCSDVYLLAVQPSLLDRRQERDTIRSTWGSVAGTQKWPNRKVNANVKVIFVVGDHHSQNVDTSRLRENINTSTTHQHFQNTSELPEYIKAEAIKHKDILYIDMIDSYRNLTRKLLSAFMWVRDKCPCVKFVLKVDYDTFVNVPLLVDTLLYFENRFEFSIVGMLYNGRKAVSRSSNRWAIPQEMYPMSSYPCYASGCGYVLPYKVLSKIVDAAPHFPLLPIEDAFFTGVMRRAIECRTHSLTSAFTHFLDRSWDHCLMEKDKKILGQTANGEKHWFLWQSFINGTCAIPINQTTKAPVNYSLLNSTLSVLPRLTMS